MPAPATPPHALPHRPTALLLLLTPLATALACQHLPPRHHTFAWHSLQLLQAMAPSPTQPCHHQHPPLFPDTLLHNNHPHHAHHAALRILQHLFATLSSHDTPQHWHHHARQRLLNNLEHYIHHLERCVPANRTPLKSQGPRNLLLNLNKYFKRIQDFLHAHNHSACAWHHVRLQAQRCLQHVDTLLRRINTQDAPQQSQSHPPQTPSPSQPWWPRIHHSLQQPALGSLTTAPTSDRHQTAPTGTQA
ncbi:interferon-like [Aegotheles albertisi]